MNRALLMIVLLMAAALPTHAQQPVEPAEDGQVTVQAGQVAVVFDFISGELLTPLRPGRHQIDLARQQAYLYPTGQQNFSVPPPGGDGTPADQTTEAYSADGINLRITHTTLYSIDPAQVNALHLRWGAGYARDFVAPTVRAAVRAAVSTYNANALYGSDRVNIVRLIEEELTTRFAAEGLTLSAFLLQDVRFPDAFTQAIEGSVVAQRERERARIAAEIARIEAQGQAQAAIDRAEAEAQVALIRAETLAESLRLISGVVADNPLLVYVLYIDMLEATASQWRMPPTLTFPNSMSTGE